MEEEIIRLRNEGKSIKEICIILNRKKGTIGYYIKKLGLNNNLPPEIKLEIKRLLENKKTRKEISTILNISFEKVSSYLNNNKIKKPKPTLDESKRKKSLNVINWKKRKKKELVEYKGGKCEKCGYNKCITALEFHHLDPTKKDFQISGKNYKIERLKEEVDKCILVCSNCHREIHELIDIKK